jgi:MoaA/NifB/PqqE/SkfB family radical SAM enzyme
MHFLGITMVVRLEILKNRGEKMVTNMTIRMFKMGIGNSILRKQISRHLYGRMYKEIVLNDKGSPRAIQERKFQFARAMAESILRNMDRGYIKKNILDRPLASTFLDCFITNKTAQKTKESFHRQHGEDPPSFVVVSPTQKCNLRCKGCYASSNADTCATLPFETLRKIIRENYSVFGNRFVTISGGEPFLYEDNAKTFFDIWKEYPDVMFLVYTNGTLITKETARRLAELGNVTPAISVEGYERETDARRGDGIYKRILRAFSNLREEGVPFGISVTATSKNADVLLTDEFYDYYFQEVGATYMWQFHLMPIGRARDAKELMLSPEQRIRLYNKWKGLLSEKNYMVADFWNSGVLSNGCIAYGRGGGYLYVDWNGNIMPCVFVPYYVDNILRLHSQGKSLTDALFSQFFKNGRKWQREYGLEDKQNPHNWLMPCSIRDHYENFVHNILTPDAKPENKEAQISIQSKEYLAMMDEFDRELKRRATPIWYEDYGISHELLLKEQVSMEGKPAELTP